jgi:hypothetical protein
MSAALQQGYGVASLCDKLREPVLAKLANVAAATSAALPI